MNGLLGFYKGRAGHEWYCFTLFAALWASLWRGREGGMSDGVFFEEVLDVGGGGVSRCG